jgi:hypothetical protein
MGPNTVGVSFPSHEGGKTFSSRKVVFSSYLEFRTMAKVQKPSDPECYTYIIVRTLLIQLYK